MDPVRLIHGSGRAIRLLVVDTDRDSVAYVLRQAGRYEHEVVEVQVAGSCAEAISMAMALSPDVILIDPDLPDGDGMNAIATILRSAPCAVLVMARRAEPEDISWAMAIGARGYIVKPLDHLRARSMSGCVITPADIVYALLAPAPSPS